MPRSMGELLPVYIVLLLLVAGCLYLQHRRALPATARAEVAGPLVPFVLALIAICGLELFLGPFFGSVWGAVVAGLAAACALLSGWNVARKKRDSTLLMRVGYADLPPWAAKACGVVLVLFFLATVFLRWPRVTPFEICWPLLLIVLPVLCLQGRANGVQLRDLGVLSDLRLLPWRSIDSYAFDDVYRTVTLNLARRSLSNPLARLTFPVPFVDESETLAILDERLHP